MDLTPQQLHELGWLAVGWLSGVATVGIYICYRVDCLIKGRKSFRID